MPNYRIIQQDEEFGTFSAEELVWLNQRGYIQDEDRCFQEDAPHRIRRTYDMLNQQCVAELQAAGVPLDRPLRPRALGTPKLSTMRGMQWVELLLERPDFLHFIRLDVLTGKEWLYLIQRDSSYLPYCRWGTFQPSQWDILVKRGFVDASVAEFSLATPGEQLESLVENPELDRYVNFERYTAFDWENLVLRSPIFMQRHPEWIDSCSASHLRNQYLDESFPEALLPLMPGDKLTGGDWLALMAARPMLAKYCPWKNVIDSVMKLPNGSATSRYQHLPDESMTYHHGQQNAYDSFRELWEHREDVFVYTDSASLERQLERSQVLLLYDFMGWERHLDISGLSREEKVDILAKHPDFGDAWQCWGKLPLSDKLELVRRSPSLFNRLNFRRGNIPRPLWEQLYDAAKERDDENALAWICPLGVMDWLGGHHRNNVVLRNRIFMRWLFVALVFFIYRFLFVK